MEAIKSPTLAEQVRTLPREGAGRDRQLHRLIDVHASTEAVAALQTAASRAGDGFLARALSSAGAILGGLADQKTFETLRVTVSSPQFLAAVPDLVRELRESASSSPETGACTVASALELWLWSMKHFRTGEMPEAVNETAEVISPLLAARCLALAVAGKPDSVEAELRADLSHVHAAHVAAAAGASLAELVFGYRRHLTWDAEGCATCFDGDDVDDLEALMPGIASGARMEAAVVEADGSHAEKAGPCARFDGVETFTKLRARLDGCLTGARIARDRAAAAIAGSILITKTEGNA